MKHLLIFFLCLISFSLSAQEGDVELEGTVSFVTSQNIYVKFDDTSPIELGDTLLWNVLDEEIPCLVVKNKSTTSIVCEKLDNCSIAIESTVLYRNSKKIEEPVIGQSESRITTSTKERVRGRVSAASYSNFSNVRDESHRSMYRLSLNADHINESKFSAETYLNYRKLYVSDENTPSRGTSFFNVYNLALRYDVDTTMSITLGRKINNKASSLGAIDGLQMEKYFGNIYTGVIAGFRPDFVDYKVNTDLLEYGAYLGLEQRSGAIYSRTTLGLLQQNNSGNVDRRYLYAQHSSTINKNLNFFGSAELDLFNKLDGESLSSARLTNFYVSSRYRFSRKVDVNLSYDSRKRIMYYETFQSDIERLLEDDEARQGIRTRVNIRPAKYTSFGLSYSKRFQSSNQNKSDNFNGYLSYSKLPGVGGRINLSFNQNESNYLKSQIISIRHSRDLIKKKLSADLYYRMVDYSYTYDGATESSNTQTQQYYMGGNLMYRFNRTLTFSVLGEYATRETEENSRVNMRLIKRFDSKKKKKKTK